MNFDHIANRYVSLLLDSAAAAGFDRTALERAAQIDTASLNDFNGVTPLPAFYKLIDRLVVKRPDFGMTFGKVLTISTTGQLAELLMSSKTLKDACLYALRFYALADFPLRIEVKSCSEVIVAELCLPHDCVYDRRRFFAEFTLVSWMRHIQFLIQGRFLFSHLNLAYPAPAYADQYRKLLSPVVEFGGEQTMVGFCERDLERPVISANAIVEQMQLESCRQKLRQRGDTSLFSDRIRQLLLRNSRPLTLEQIADQLNMATRTIRKHLRKEQVSYRQILQSVQRQKACQYLVTQKLPVEKVANLLGYNDCANFRRAFKMWTGITPAAYQQRVSLQGSAGRN
ncbi:AraC family transcriptional regulator [Exilibacterium tricleocarpae]|uniref:AraC family transcriptional regulator n=1 Tax=Exilibacterium tricleocarpae TaxID=2591008 RepID=A0A545TZ90_9GAMM|nr:AraC family transcriptional regulator [Exilibacterium tricleocarpae]TQV82539.1 AraC family transcriptional regulator [Exilibacterium tricleocarpae]